MDTAQGAKRYQDGHFTRDGLRLHYRDYAGNPSRPPIVCIPGLTRNARDFEGVAARLAGDWRVICVELRGRGESAYAKDPMTYVPLTYLQDMEALIRELALERFILFGTSLGGLVTMLLAMNGSERIAAALINDIGPVLDRKGLDRIRSYVGHFRGWPSWEEAARFLGEMQHDVFPDWGADEWLVFARRVCRETDEGEIVLDYDMRIAEPFRKPGGDTGFDPWLAFRALEGVPTLAVRGELSDLLDEETLAEMERELPTLETVTVPRVGHAPTLEEPEAQEAIDRLLARIQP